MTKIQLENGWKVLQDVHDLGEKMQIYEPSFMPADSFLSCISDWQDLERLDYLQLIYAKNPYYGRELRYFNSAPWWYKNIFIVQEEKTGCSSIIRFQGVDYFCKVWLNGIYLGEHEGYFSTIEFEVGGILKFNEPNHLVVKVWSPHDDQIEYLCQLGKDVSHMTRFLTSQKNMIKGTYEHADGFIQRDINPVGIYREVSIELYDKIRFDGEPQIITALAEDSLKSSVNIKVPLYSTVDIIDIKCKCCLFDERRGEMCVSETVERIADKGINNIEFDLQMISPKLWNCWDRGEANIYSARFELYVSDKKVGVLNRKFGFREIELLRDEQQTTFILNKKKIYLRGTSYFPEVYLSKMNRERYERDIRAMKASGFNAVRVHVHVARPEFYDVCDEYGLLVIQDSDLTWFHPQTEEFTERAITVFGDMICMLRNHPSIICWVCLNEPDLWKLAKERKEIVLDENPMSMMDECPGPQLVKELKILDPTRPYIKGSHFKDDPESGDEHNYIGSLRGQESHYTEMYGENFKLLSEFGMDAPAAKENVTEFKEMYEKLKSILINNNDYDSLHYYRYRYFKYIIEYLRITKYRPCSGYFQFLFSDIIPQCAYGIYDWWGTPKKYLNVFDESNQPIGIFMEYTTKPIALWAVNDFSEDIGLCSAEWNFVNKDGVEIICMNKKINLVCDCLIKIIDLDFITEISSIYMINLQIKDYNERVIAKNTYIDPFNHPPHPKGHPMRMDQEIGIRLFWA